MIPPELVMIRHIARSADREILRGKMGRELPRRSVPVCGLVWFVCVCVRHRNTHTEANRTE